MSSFILNRFEIHIKGARVTSDTQYDNHRANATLSNGLIINVRDSKDGNLDLLVSREDEKTILANVGEQTNLGLRVRQMTFEDEIVIKRGLFRPSTRISFFPTTSK